MDVIILCSIEWQTAALFCRLVREIYLGIKNCQEELLLCVMAGVFQDPLGIILDES